MNREDNIRVFEDTCDMCRNDHNLRSAVRKSLQGQTLILSSDNYTPRAENSYEKNARVIVSVKRTFEAASAYRGMKTCVLNFASAVNPGGGVKKGSTAQEESLSRTSTLYQCLRDSRLWVSFYSVNRMRCDRRNSDDVIYTPGVIVFKSDDECPRTLPEDEWYSVNVVSSAAPDLRAPHPGSSDYGVRTAAIGRSELFSLHYRRMKRILEIAAGEGNEAVILGAFGCGAFRNPPELVASAVRKAVDEFLTRFRVIEFAVYTAPGSDGRNYTAFRSAFRDLM